MSIFGLDVKIIFQLSFVFGVSLNYRTGNENVKITSYFFKKFSIENLLCLGL